jgi:hypothetical protein
MFGFLRILDGQRFAVALCLTFIFWLLLNYMWPDFRLTFDETIALFFIIFFVIYDLGTIVDMTKHWISRRG